MPEDMEEFQAEVVMDTIVEQLEVYLKLIQSGADKQRLDQAKREVVASDRRELARAITSETEIDYDSLKRELRWFEDKLVEMFNEEFDEAESIPDELVRSAAQVGFEKRLVKELEDDS